MGSSPQHPCPVWFVFFLDPCLSAHLSLPNLRRCPCLDLPTPEGLGPGSPGLDMVYGSVVIVPPTSACCFQNGILPSNLILVGGLVYQFVLVTEWKSPNSAEEPGQVFFDFSLIPRPMNVLFKQLQANEVERTET